MRAALIGVESFSEEGLKSANKQWNPTGQKMVETIQTIQDAGILVLSSIICGLESDTPQTLRTMREFALQSGTILAQFPIYHPYPGTKDFREMVSDIQVRATPGGVPKHKTEIIQERFWLKQTNELDLMIHPNMTKEVLWAETQDCWKAFYSVRAIIDRTRRGRAKGWPLAAKFVYLLFCLSFLKIYSGQGMTADSVRRRKVGWGTKIFTKVGIAIYNRIYRKALAGQVGAPLGSAPPLRPVIRPDVSLVQVSQSGSPGVDVFED